jgi:hypothetical protein
MAAPPIVERHKHHFHRQSPIKETVRVATTADITIATALNVGDTIDGVVLADGDRVLVKDQGTGSQNGIYVAGASPARDYDVSTDDPDIRGSLIYVRDGTANGGKLFRSTNLTLPTIGTTSLVFAEFTAASAFSLTVEEGDGAPTVSDVDTIVFDETDFTVTNDGGGQVTITAIGGGGSTVDIEDEGAAEGAADTIDFTGAGVSVTFAAGTATVDIPGGGGGLTTAYVGYNTIGATWETSAANEWAIAKQIVLANDCLIDTVEAYMQAVAGNIAYLSAALYTDNAGNPQYPFRGFPERASGVFQVPATTPRWMGVGGLGWVAAGTYWLVIRTTDLGGSVLPQIAYDAGSDQTQDFPGSTVWPTWGGSATARKYSIRAHTIR